MAKAGNMGVSGGWPPLAWKEKDMDRQIDGRILGALGLAVSLIMLAVHGW